MKDLVIIGAGPVGMYGCFYASLNNLNILLIELDKNIGGAPAKMYPEKNLYDIPGFVKISGSEFIKNLKKQLETKQNWSKLTSTNICNIRKNDNDIFELTDTNDNKFFAKYVIVCTGYGAFEFKTINKDVIRHDVDKSKINHFVKSIHKYKDKELVICGGGNSAMDYANLLSEYAKSVNIIHYSDRFSCLKNSLEEAKNKSNIYINENCEILEITNNYIKLKKHDEEKLIEQFDEILVFYGVEQISHNLTDLHFFNDKKQIEVDHNFESIKMPGLFACGKSNNLNLNNLMVNGFSQICVAIDEIAKRMK